MIIGLSLFNQFSKACLNFLVLGYRVIGSPSMGGSCRFYPSCSVYATECISTLSPSIALFLIIKRLIKCRPFGDYGYDPVPEKGQFSKGCSCGK